MLQRSQSSDSVRHRSPRWWGPVNSIAAPYLFLVPAVVLTAGTLAYPLVYSAILSLYETNPATLVDSFVGLRNYADLFASDRFLFAMVRTAFYALTSSFAALVIGLVVALCIHHLDFRYKSLLLGLLFVPWVMSPVEVALIGKWMVHPIFGPLNHALVWLGIIPRNTSLLGQPATALATITAVYTWKHVPFVMVVLYAALQTLPKAIYEAGRLDGAGGFGLFWHLTLPLLRPIMVTTFLLIVIWQFGSYAVFDVMTGGGPRGSTEVLSIFIVDRFERRHFGESATVAVVLFALAAVLTVVYLHTEFRRLRER